MYTDHSPESFCSMPLLLCRVGQHHKLQILSRSSPDTLTAHFPSENKNKIHKTYIPEIYVLGLTTILFHINNCKFEKYQILSSDFVYGCLIQQSIILFCSKNKDFK